MKRRDLLTLPATAALAFSANPKPAKLTPGQLAADPQRPKFHLLPAANWMNDPNGPIYWKGRYHMFYQYNPNGAFWGTMHWGHAVSSDMVHWRHMPVAMAPQPGLYDKEGVFSGCCVVNEGVPTFVYTGTRPEESQCIATARADDLRSWKRPASNPVIAAPPEGIDATGFRDPCVWKQNDQWFMALGSGQKGVGGMVLLYQSPDLTKWNYIGPLFEGKLDPEAKGNNVVARGEMWECPSFFPLGEKHVLFVSTRGTTPCWIGTFKDNRFSAEWEGSIDTGSYYAPITQLDDRGRRVVWGWIQEQRNSEAQRAAGWSGVMSLPRVLSVRQDGSLGINFAPQLRSLRGKRQEFVGLFIPEDKPEPVPGVAGDALELLATFDMGDADEVGLQVLGTPVLYSHSRKRLRIGTARLEQNNNLQVQRGEPLRLHIYADCSVIEVIADGKCALTGRSYQAPGDSQQVYAIANGGSAKLRSFTAYEVRPISSDRLTT